MCTARTTPLAAFFLSLLLALPLLCSLPAGAQEKAPALPEQLQPAAMEKLVKDLDPEQVDALTQLMNLLQQGASAKEAAPVTAEEEELDLIQEVDEAMEKFGTLVATQFRNLPDLLSGVVGGIDALVSGSVAGPMHLFLGAIALLLVVGFAAEFFVNRLAARRRERIRTEKPDTLYETVKLVSLRAALDLGGLLVFALCVIIVARVAILNHETRTFALQAVYWLVFLPRLVAAVLRFALAPHRRDLRLVTTDDVTAKSLYRSFTILFIVVGISFFLRNVMQNAGEDTSETFRFFVGIGVNLWIIAIIWKSRRGLTSILLGDDANPSTGLERMARFWPYFSIAFIVFNFLLVAFSVSLGSEALTAGRSLAVIALVIFAPFLDTMARGIVSHIVPPMQGEGPIAEAAHMQTRHSYMRIARIALLAFLVLMIGRIYGLNLLAIGSDDGSSVARHTVIFLLILAAGYLAWEITNLWVAYQLAKDSPPVASVDEDAEMGGAGKSRLATILPLMRMVVQITILTLTILLALSQLGVNITPLLAGAGVIGLAIGFGAQTLVRDVVSGVFFLMDDAFRLGEFIDAGGTQGTIEKISIRSLQLRGSRGPVHIVPYGEIPKLTNLSRDWVIMKLKFTVPFDTDVEKVRKIFKRIGQEIMEMEEFKDDILAPFKGQGVADVDDVGIVVRGKYTTKPGKQFGVRKEIYKRVQQAFEENGIQFARKEVRVNIPESANLDDKQKETVVAAAAAAVASNETKPAAE
ncbi:mechanosensitive ion channel [Rhodobacterales bacterium]|nr:mechanosensitive ion channel [Rhodobacterales bacterium]